MSARAELLAFMVSIRPKVPASIASSNGSVSPYSGTPSGSVDTDWCVSSALRNCLDNIPVENPSNLQRSCFGFVSDG